MIWTRDQEDTLRRMYAAGCMDKEIALALQVTKRAVSGKRRTIGLYGRKSDAYDSAMRRASRERTKEAV